MEKQSHCQSDQCRTDPSHSLGEKRQEAIYQVQKSCQMQKAGHGRWKRVDEIQNCGQQGAQDDTSVDHSIVLKPFSCEGEKDQSDGQRIEKHQHGKSAGDDGVQSQVSDSKGEKAESNCPGPVGKAGGKETVKSLGTAGDQSHGCLQTGKCHSDSQNGSACVSKVMFRDGQECFAAVGGHRVKSAALGADHSHRQVDDPHEAASEDPGFDGVGGDGFRRLNSQVFDDVDDDDAEGQAGRASMEL